MSTYWYGCQHGKYLFTLVFTSVSLFSSGILVQNVFAMGPPPSSCYNGYASTIVEFKINNGTQTFDPIAHPGITFEENSHNMYTITDIVHVAGQSSQGNTNPGSWWEENDYYNFWGSTCSDSYVSPHQNVKEGLADIYDAICPAEGCTQQVTVQTTLNSITYNVEWINPSSNTVPSASQNLRATAISSSLINLDWNAPSNDGGSTISGYLIERSIDGGSTWSTIVSNTGSTSTTSSDAGLQSSTSYTYRISAINSVGTSLPSNTASATTNPQPVITSILTVASQDSFGNIITGYYAELYPSNGTQVAAGFTPYKFTLNSGQSYTVHVENYAKYVFSHWLDTDSTNAYRTISTTSNTGIIAVFMTVPSNPTGLTATGVSSSKINLHWNTPANNGGSSIIGYKIQRSTDGGTTWMNIIKNTHSTSTAYSDTGLSPNTTYYYRVFPLNLVGTSTGSNIVYTTPLL